MEIEGFTVQEPDIHKAIDHIIEHYKSFSVVDPDLFIIYFSFDDIAVEMRSSLTYAFPNTQIAGSSSYGGVLTSSFETYDSACAISVLGFYDLDGAYGVASNLVGENPSETVNYTIDQALINSKRQGEIPRLVWFFSERMDEALTIQILESKFGSSVPILGGTPGHSTLSKEAFSQNFVYHNERAIVVILFYPSCEIVTNHANFYYPLAKTGIISKVSENNLLEIDNCGAQEVYLDWIKNYLPVELFEDEEKAKNSIFLNYPLGVRVGLSTDGSLYRIFYILDYDKDNGLNVHNRLSVGDRITLMHSYDRDKIVAKFKEIFGQIANKKTKPLASMSSVCYLLKDNFNEDSFSFMSHFQFPNMGFFAEGEHGCLSNGMNVYASLMLCNVAFYPREED